MRQLLLAMLMAASSQAVAEWVQVGESGDLTFYVDPSTITRLDSTVKMASLHDHKTPRANVRGWLYRSEKIQSEFDCQRERWRAVYSTFHFGQMGRGPVSGDSRSYEWMAVAPESIAEAAWKLACGKK